MTIPTEQKALILPEKQGQFVVATWPVDKPETGEVLVRIEATALNPADWKVQAYGGLVNEYPAILGFDSAGVVVAVGEDVASPLVGDKILFQSTLTPRLAGFKQYTIAKANATAQIPDNINFDQAATVPIGLGTAAVGLYARSWARGGADLIPGWEAAGRAKYTNQPIVVFGGSSSVGQYAIQLARLNGFSPIIATVSTHNNDLVRSVGATHTIDRRLSTSAIVSKVKEVTSEPVEVIFDAISIASTQETAYEILASGGKLVLVHPSSIPQDKVKADKTVINTGVLAPDNKPVIENLYKRLTQHLASGDIKPNAVELLPGGLAGIAKGLEKMKNDAISGKKLVAHPQETV